jgi:hypothetical protein
MHLWNKFASAEAALVFGAMCFAIYLWSGRYRDSTGKTDPTRLVGMALQTTLAYVLAVLVYGHFLAKFPIHETIEKGFGSDRIGYLLLGLLLETVARIVGYCDNSK